jgi:hypothetical protein
MSTSVDPTHPTHPTGPARSTGPGPSSHDPVAGITAALDATDNLDRLPTARHVEAYEHVHTALTDALSAIDEV